MILLKIENKQTKPKKKNLRNRSWPRKADLGFWGGTRVGWMGILGIWGMQTVCYIWNGWAMNPTVQHKERCVTGSLCCITELD